MTLSTKWQYQQKDNTNVSLHPLHMTKRSQYTDWQVDRRLVKGQSEAEEQDRVTMWIGSTGFLLLN